MYASFIFVSIAEDFKTNNEDLKKNYQARLEILRKYFLEMDDKDLIGSASVILSKVRLLKEQGPVVKLSIF